MKRFEGENEFLTFKTIDLEKSKLDHSKSSKKWKERAVKLKKISPSFFD